MEMKTHNEITFLTRFFRAVAEDMTIPEDTKERNCEIIKAKISEGKTNG